MPERLPRATFAAPGVSPDWRLVFRSNDPSIWNQEVNRNENDLAHPLAEVTDEVQYLRLRKGDDYVILEVNGERLGKRLDDGRYGWEGSNDLSWNGHHLGIYSRIWPPKENPTVTVCANPSLLGWGFGHRWGPGDVQGYTWAGKSIPKTVFEVTVKSGNLTPEESAKLLRAGMPRIGTAEAPKAEGGWQVVFRSNDPAIWNDDVRTGPDQFAMALEAVPEGVRYLRLTNTRNKEFVIIEMTNERLRQRKDDGRYGWEGSNEFIWAAHHLGIYSRLWPPKENPTVTVCTNPAVLGWGFGHRWGPGDVQGYTWAGKSIPKSVFEVAVKREDLTADENRKLLKTGNPRLGDADPPKDEGGWQVIFRSKDPAIWNDDVRLGPDQFAMALETVPEGVQYLRLTNTRTKEFVIIEMTNDRLGKRTDNGKIGWDGMNVFGYQGHHLGIFSKEDKPKPEHWIAVSGGPFFPGWGFGHISGVDDEQACSWGSKQIAKVVLEIAVKREELTKPERAKLLE
jgi:hypothetical protein